MLLLENCSIFVITLTDSESDPSSLETVTQSPNEAMNIESGTDTISPLVQIIDLFTVPVKQYHLLKFLCYLLEKTRRGQGIVYQLTYCGRCLINSIELVFL